MVPMVIGNFIVRCPCCSTETRLVIEMISPVMVYCSGCNRSIIIQNGIIYTLPADYVHELLKKYKVRACGRIIGADISEQAKKMITSDKISELRDLLSKPMDVRDFLRKIK